MSQFGAAAAAAKNPPWVRTTAQAIATSVAQQQQLQNQMLTQTALGALGNPAMVQYQQQQQQQQVFQSPMQMQQMFSQVATVSYPTPRALNPAAFQSAAVAAAAAAAVPPVPPANPNPSPKQRVFTGTVTKVHDNFGFVDEDVFFQTSCCVKGSNPVVGDRVLVEASYNPNMPFKWNATRIQVLPMSATAAQRNQTTANKGFSSSGSGTYSAVPPPVENSNSGNFGSRNNQRKIGVTGSRRERSKDRSRDREDEEEDRKKRREERAREREEKEKRSPSVRRRSKSPRPQPRRRARIVPRYMVQIPKIALDLPEADVLELRRRYTNLYIPSDFFSTNFRWVDAFPPNSPFTLDRPCSFHVMNKEVDPVIENKAVLEPPDADYLFSAKVMLMSMPTMEEVYRKCCALAEDKDKDDERDFVHPTRLVNFLVGLRGKNETMAVGGPWSPSLDGSNPENDPSVLIKTAIRTCQALTGINLSACTRWYRFLEIYYRRGETTHKGRVVPARVETVVLFLPDVWSCVPTRLEWDGLHLNYKKQLERKLKADQDVANGATGDEKDEEESSGSQEAKKEPTHYSELDPKGMKVSELRQELEARTLSPKGLKSQLIARLTKAIKTEAEKAEEQEEKKVAEPEPPSKSDAENKDDEKKKKEEEEKKKQDEKDKVAREKRYTLPESPHILVHPSRTAKSGKFDCTIMSLSLLLDYRPEDTKEHSFEVSLFAELFNEMLMRDYGFNIYRSLHQAPERPKEEEKEKDRKKDRDKKDEKDKKDDKRDDRKNGDREDKDKKRDDRHSKDKKDDRSRNEEKEKSNDKDDEDDDEEDDEEDEDSKDSKKDKDKDDKDKKRNKDKDKKKKKEKVKLYTEDPNLLLSFIYFDQSHCGYIFDKDIEELLYTLGLNLSRAQVRKLVQKVVTRDSLHYRKLTDKEVKSDDVKETEKEKAKESEKEGGSSSESDESLAYGNKRLLPVFSAGLPPSKRARKDTGTENETVSIPEGYMMHKGALLDVEKLMEQLQRSERARLETESKMMSLKQDLSELKETAKHSSNTVKELSSELREYKQKLQETDRELSRSKASADAYYGTLKDIHRKITPVLSHDTEVSEVRVKTESGHSAKRSSPSADTVKGENRSEKKAEYTNGKKEGKEKPSEEQQHQHDTKVKEEHEEKKSKEKQKEEEKKDDSKSETVEMEVD
ncbi:cell division cycle and apoptosis regulator protein 1 isoform X2 [Anabrus simplex]|uniref:cell division cycle and apoptosis regulator protein 1 isoform X2 n=1 Tax=Anabrus simplex TaxID=316456 RepID=UPI0035A32B7A